MEKYQAVIYGVKVNAETKQERTICALLPFSVLAKDVKGKELKNEDGTPQFISDVNFFTNMLKYQLAEMKAEELVKYDYLFSTISVSGRKYGQVTHFGYVDGTNTLCEIGDFGTDENGLLRTAKDVFPKSATLLKKAKKGTGKELHELSAKERREWCRNIAADVVTRCNFLNDTLKHWDELNA